MRAAIFDMDGTLFDTEQIYREAWLKVAEPFGLEPNPELGKAVSGTGGFITLNIIYSFYPEQNPQDLSKWVEDYVFEESGKHLDIMQGVPEILEYFKSQNFKLAVASGTETATVGRNLKNAKLKEYFSVVIGGDMIHDGGKPRPGIFLKAIEELGIPAEECYVFEDAFNGIRAAFDAKCVPILVNPYDEYSKATPEIKSEMDKKSRKIFLNMNDALDWIKNQ